MVIEAAYNPRGLIISESRVFCSCANPLGRIFEIAEILASYIQFLRNKKAQLHFVAVLFFIVPPYRQISLHCKDRRRRQSTVASKQVHACFCGGLHASNSIHAYICKLQRPICAQPLRGLSLNSTGVVDMRPTAVIGELRLSGLSLVGWGANRDWRE